MKHLLLPLLLLSAGSLWAQSFYLNFTDGTQAAYNISDVRKITFTGNIMNLNKTDGTVYSWDVNTIEECRLDETVTSIGPKGNTLTPVKIFPNPTGGVIEITYALETETQVTLVATSPTTGMKMDFSSGRERNPKDDFSTSFQPISFKQRSTDSSWSDEQSVTVNLLEFSRRNIVVFHVEVE